MFAKTVFLMVFKKKKKINEIKTRFHNFFSYIYFEVLAFYLISVNVRFEINYCSQILNQQIFIGSFNIVSKYLMEKLKIAA